MKTQTPIFLFFIFLNIAIGLSGSLYFTSFKAHAAISNTRLEHLPPLEDLEKAMLDRAGLDPDQIKSWQKRSRWAAALPRFQVGWESKFLNQNTTVIQDNLSVTSSGITVGPESNRLDVDLENNQNLEVRAVWAFDELVFNREELSVSREARDLYFVRTRLIEELHQAYFDLKSLLLSAEEDESLRQEMIWNLKVEQQFEKINSLTGGFLKQHPIRFSKTPLSSTRPVKPKTSEKDLP